MEFKGSIHELQAIVKEVGIAGHWHDQGLFYLFHSDDGAILNWWPKTYLVSFQGTPDKKERLKALLEEKTGIQSLEMGAISDQFMADATQCSTPKHSAPYQCNPPR